MSLDLGTLAIEAVIVHQIPKSGQGIPFYSEICSPLDDNLKRYIKQRIIESAKSSASFPVALDEDTNSPVPAFIQAHIGNSQKFVEQSRATAEYLVKLQNKLHSAGLLTVVDCRVKRQRALAVLKLERNSGIRAAATEIGGKKTLAIERVPELMLTDSNRVFKAGVFTEVNGQVAGIVSDYQRSLDVAKFFLTFLGCRLLEEPNVATRKFFKATEAYIDQAIKDPQTKISYQMALAAEMQSPKKQIRPRSFAEEHMATRDIQPYLEYLKNADADTSTYKDTALIATRITGLHMAFATGISVYLPPDAIKEGQVHIQKIDDGDTKLTIRDKLLSTKGRPRGRRSKQPA